MTQKAIKEALDGKLSTSGTAAAATKATNDSANQQINTTYIKNATVSGKVVTFTKGDNSTFSITTQDTDNNTTYATGTSTSAGLTKLYTGTGSNTDGTMTQSAIKSALDAKLSTSGTAAAATKDSGGNTINTTYIKAASVSGKVVTFTKGDGSTFTITTQDTDNNTTYATGTTGTAGLTKLYTTTGTNTDGTMTQSAIKSALDGKLNSTATAAAATKDSANQQINTTYIKNASASGKTVTFTKGDGSTFTISTQDSNTTYATGTTAATGLTKLYSSTGTNTDGTIRQKELSTLINGKLDSTATAAAATKDSANQQINTTYIKNASVNGKVVTFTKGDGSTFTITTQDTDNNTTYATGTTAATGLTKLYTTTGTATDGTIRQKELSTLINGKLSTSGTAAAAKVLNNSTSTNSLGDNVLVDFGDEG
jgi:ribosomal protein L21